jgi:diaminohydroxyphosphoribosylaminopyrimidine deaminase/5-amino-6-(5-phosphoribosylamino)uracil reductase
MDPQGRVLGEGWHHGAGQPHAEVEALMAVRAHGHTAAGATAVVTLEPCHHHGRTGPCSHALAEAGIARVVAAIADPNPLAQGGADYLRAKGLQVTLDAAPAKALELNRPWIHAVTAGRPYVTWKTACTLDGRIAAADGSSRWITGTEARAHAHAQRGRVDAMVVGSGTLLADDPRLTARTPDGALAAHQPLRVVVGRRPIPPTAAINGPGGELVHVANRDPHQVLRLLAAREVRHVLIEGGATLAGAWFQAGVVDAVQAYIAPMVLGQGLNALGPAGVASLDGAPRLGLAGVTTLGQDVLIEARRA